MNIGRLRPGVNALARLPSKAWSSQSYSIVSGHEPAVLEGRQDWACIVITIHSDTAETGEHNCNQVLQPRTSLDRQLPSIANELPRPALSSSRK